MSQYESQYEIWNEYAVYSSAQHKSNVGGKNVFMANV